MVGLIRPGSDVSFMNIVRMHYVHIGRNIEPKDE
jgi:hypothetical protein